MTWTFGLIRIGCLTWWQTLDTRLGSVLPLLDDGVWLRGRCCGEFRINALSLCPEFGSPLLFLHLFRSSTYIEAILWDNKVIKISVYISIYIVCVYMYICVYIHMYIYKISLLLLYFGLSLLWFMLDFSLCFWEDCHGQDIWKETLTESKLKTLKMSQVPEAVAFLFAYLTS